MLPVNTVMCTLSFVHGGRWRPCLQRRANHSNANDLSLCRELVVAAEATPGTCWSAGTTDCVKMVGFSAFQKRRPRVGVAKTCILLFGQQGSKVGCKKTNNDWLPIHLLTNWFKCFCWTKLLLKKNVALM